MPNIIADAVAFPIECQSILNKKLGVNAKSYLESLDKFVFEIIREVDDIFLKRLSNIKGAFEKERKRPGDKIIRQERLKAQISAYSPKLLAQDIDSSVQKIHSYKIYQSTLAPFLVDQFTSDIIKRYALSEELYIQLMRGVTHSLNDLSPQMVMLVSTLNNLDNTIKSLSTSNGIKKVIRMAASIVGGIGGSVLGHAAGIHRGGGGAGSRLGGSLVGMLFGDDKKIDVALNDCHAAFESINTKWLSIRNKLRDELQGVIYSIYGGALLRLIEDMHILGMSISTLNINNNVLGSSCILKVSLNAQTEEKFITWAKQTIVLIDEKTEQGRFDDTYRLSLRSLMFCVQNKLRLQVCNDEMQSFAMLFQQRLVNAAVMIANQIGQQSLEQLLNHWLKASKNLAFLPDEKARSSLTFPIVVASELLSKNLEENRASAVKLINDLRDLYIERSQYVTKSKSDYLSISGEKYSARALFMLSIVLSNHEDTKDGFEKLNSISEFRKVINQRGLDQLISCLVVARRSGATWSNKIHKNLLKRIAFRSLTILSLSFIILIVGFVIWKSYIQ